MLDNVVVTQTIDNYQKYVVIRGCCKLSLHARRATFSKHDSDDAFINAQS